MMIGATKPDGNGTWTSHFDDPIDPDLCGLVTVTAAGPIRCDEPANFWAMSRVRPPDADVTYDFTYYRCAKHGLLVTAGYWVMTREEALTAFVMGS